MSRLRLCLASLLFATTASACAPTLAHTSTPDSARIEIDRARLRAKLAERRAQTVKNFLAYREGRVYPINDQGGGFRHVWVDQAGNLCAAATLLSKDWGRDAALRVGAANGGIKLADATGSVADWILTSGMTRAEMVSIQVPGFNERFGEDQRQQEITRLYQIYVDVERQVNSLWNANLDLAVDQLMKRPDLAHEVLGGRVAGPGAYAQPPIG